MGSLLGNAIMMQKANIVTDLTFVSYVGGNDVDLLGYFTFTLSQALPFNLTIADAEVIIYNAAGCTSFIDAALQPTPATITAGNTSVFSTSSSVVCGSNGSYSRVDSLTVAGNAVTNGSTITVSGATINIIISNACSNLFCQS